MILTMAKKEMENLTSIQEILKEKHSLIEWAILFKKYPELREEFEKQNPPKPIE